MFEETVPRTTKEDRAKYRQISVDISEAEKTVNEYNDLLRKKESEGLSAEESVSFKEIERKRKLIDRYLQGNPAYIEKENAYTEVELKNEDGSIDSIVLESYLFNKNPYIFNFVEDCYDMAVYERCGYGKAHREKLNKTTKTQFAASINPFLMEERDLWFGYNRLSYDNPFDEGYSITAAVQYCNNMFIEEVPDGIVERHEDDSRVESKLIGLNRFRFRNREYKYGDILNHELLKRMQKQNKAYAKRCNEDYIDALSNVQNIIAKGEDIANNLSEYEYIENICDKKNRKD